MKSRPGLGVFLLTAAVSGLARAQCACVASPSGIAPHLNAGTYQVIGTVDVRADSNGQCFDPGCSGVHCAFTFEITATVTYTAGNRPVVGADVYDNSVFSFHLGPIASLVPPSVPPAPPTPGLDYYVIKMSTAVPCEHTYSGTMTFELQGAVSTSGSVTCACGGNCENM